MDIQAGEVYTTEDGFTVKIVNIKVKLHSGMSVVIKCEVNGEFEYIILPGNEKEVKTWVRVEA